MSAGEFPLGMAGAVAYQVETTPGTKPGSWAPEWLMWDSNGLNVTEIKEQFVLAQGSLSSQRTRGTYKDAAGPIVTKLFPNQCGPLLAGVLGSVTKMTAVTADTIKTGNATTTNGTTSIPLTTNAGTLYQVGAPLTIGAGATLEKHQIISATGAASSGVIVVSGAMQFAANLLAGVAINQLVMFKCMEIQPGSTVTSPALDFGGLPSFYVEDQRAQLTNSLIYPQSYVDKVGLKFDEHLPTATWQLESCGPRTEAAKTSYAPSASDVLDAQSPFSGVNSYVTAYSDPTGSGTGAFRSFNDWTSLDIEIMNNFAKWNKPANEWVFKYRKGRTGTIKYPYRDQSGRATPTEYKELIDTINGTSALQPFMVMAACNQASSGSPKWQSVSLYVPNAYYHAAPITNPVDDVIGVNIDAAMQQDSNADPLVYIFLEVNATSGAAYWS